MKKWQAVFVGLFLAAALSACSAEKEAFDWAAQQTEKRGVSRKGQRGWYANMGQVPFFRDDSGNDLQEAGGYVYASMNGKLCRYDKETLEKTVLFETYADHPLKFCISDDCIYFTDRPRTASLTDRDTVLYRMKCDGTELTVLSENIPNAWEYFDTYWPEVYDDIIYLTFYSEKRYYRLPGADGELEEISERETLYGNLREDSSPALDTLPYLMRNYGYIFIWNANHNLQQMLLTKDGIQQGRQIGLPGRDGYILTNDALYCANKEENRWYRIWLDDADYPEVFLEMEDFGDVLWNWDETGIYFLRMGGGTEKLLQVQKADWEGNLTTLLNDYNIGRGDYWKARVYIVDGYLYYKERTDLDTRITRVSLSGEQKPEVVDIHKDEAAAISHGETEEQTIKILENVKFDVIFTRLFFNGDTEGEENINVFLKELYKDIEKEIADEAAELKEFREEYDFEGTEDEFNYLLIRTGVEHLDEDYVVIYVAYENYYYPGAHGMHWTDEYVFDRKTGRRLAITDVVNNTEEEICEIVSAYVERDFGWDEYMPKTSVLEQDRFFLTPEGIGIHYDVYELACYAAGSVDFVIPYEEFEMK